MLASLYVVFLSIPPTRGKKAINALGKFARAAPMNLFYSDKSVFPSGFSHRTIYPWSLDGLNQERIYKMLMFMMTAVHRGRTESTAGIRTDYTGIQWHLARMVGAPISKGAL